MDWRFFEEKDLFWILKVSKDMYKESYLEEKGVGGTVGLMMMRNFIKWAEMNDATEIVFAPTANKQLNKFDAFAKRLGMKATAKVYKRFKHE
mgnify:CR=1 FL=1